MESPESVQKRYYEKNITGNVMIEKLWNRLESWASANQPAMLADLNPGAGDAEVDSLQTSLEIKLPTAFIESLKVHNGENDGWPFKVFTGHGAYLSIEAILKNWNLRNQVALQMLEFQDQLDAEVRSGARVIAVDGPVKAVSFRPQWVPFIDCNSDIFWAMDFDPADGGVAGQIIEVDFEGGSWRVIANSFEDFFSAYVEGLEQNKPS